MKASCAPHVPRLLHCRLGPPPSAHCGAKVLAHQARYKPIIAASLGRRTCLPAVNHPPPGTGRKHALAPPPRPQPTGIRINPHRLRPSLTRIPFLAHIQQETGHISNSANQASQEHHQSSHPFSRSLRISYASIEDSKGYRCNKGFSESTKHWTTYITFCRSTSLPESSKFIRSPYPIASTWHKPTKKERKEGRNQSYRHLTSHLA